MFWLTKNLSSSLGALVVWGFLMALLFNLLMKYSKSKKDSLLFFSAFIMFSSYFISDHFWDLYKVSEIYLIWFSYDVITLIVIFWFSKTFNLKTSFGVRYVYIGLVINSLFFLSMHIDTRVLGNAEHWWLWDLYSAGVNLIDFMMIFALILDKDYLGIFRFYKFVTSPIRKKALV
ncbi:hypothetical protein [Pseudoalteromonas denitrificans]|uniref:Membrane protein triplicated sequence n=1 Tax=Pseudoalteromonas denitrificans DSM 6059 TaxID=1123010 RepID=A0A1I1L5N0_9GAMM|nr:hypothetical protein [Pseudoalteromonas denitrificans]SFC68255.1 hypothetical protein SAMN02745724_02262 [Pseudoalteromonas denitrificans DSM 6059]